MSIQHAIGQHIEAADLTQDEAEAAMDENHAGNATSARSRLLMALRMKGETIDEITGSARSMSRAAGPSAGEVAGLIDTCGHGWAMALGRSTSRRRWRLL